MTNVLIVDDEIETCRMLSTALDLFDCVPSYVLSGEAALERMRGGDLPDVVLLDLMMPGIDGFEVARQMRKDPRLAGLPIIVVTAMGELDAEDRSLAAGATAFMRKPVSIAELSSKIKQLAGA